MAGGLGSVSTLILVVVRSTEEGRGEILYHEENELAELGIEGVPGWVGDKATMRVRTAEDHTNA